VQVFGLEVVEVHDAAAPGEVLVERAQFGSDFEVGDMARRKKVMALRNSTGALNQSAAP
jgi:hypothetical protein